MQSKGAIKFLAIIIALACLYQLSFTWATSHQENKAAKYAAAAVEAERNSPAFATVPDVDKAYYLDSIAKIKNRLYIDSVSNEKVFFGFTYKQIKEKEINLGLDLKGGMNVMLQVQLKDLIKALADNNQSPEFLQALELAQKKELTSREDFITLFEQSWNEVAPAKRMASIFGTYEMRDRIRPETSNDEVIAVIREEAESAIANSFNVLRNRIDRFGVTQPNIQKIGNTGRILVELPGVKEPERVRKLLQGTASLEFWPTFDNSEVYTYLEESNRALRDILAEQDKNTALFGECKWTNEKVDLGVLETLVKRSELFPYKNVHYYLFAKTGFTKGCADRANEMGNVTLVRYEDITSKM